MAKKLKDACSFAYAMARRMALLPLARARYRGKHVWLVCERGNDARDNGWHMFRYLRTQHPEIEAWYVIDKDSVDLSKVKEYGNIAYRGSLEHWLAYLVAEKILTAFEPHFCPSDSYRFYKLMKKRQKIIFLQHGVIGNDLPLYHQERSGFDMFVCGAKPEYDFICKYFNYAHGEVKYTGLARFDALHGVLAKPQVLIMPTYRKWFRGLAREEVAKSEYVKRWGSLLKDPRLTEMAQRFQVQVVFFPHQLMQEYIGMFQSPGDWIVVADWKHYDVQALLQESALLVTDYSSVHFDFAYMNKPVLYYQFDEKEVFQKHLSRGYFDYGTMGFGEKTGDHEELLGLMEGYLSGACMPKPAYLRRIEGFFPLHDTHNCERIWQEIQNL